MKLHLSIILALVLVMLVPPSAAAKDKKKHAKRGMLESMQSVPCGIKEHGFTGIGGLWASAGIQHVNSDEKLCPQYVFRTDEMEYHIRPLDKKHPALLPVGHEGEFKIKKDKLYLKIADTDKKMRPYQVISMEPPNSQGATESTSYQATGQQAPQYGASQSSGSKQAANQATSPPHR